MATRQAPYRPNAPRPATVLVVDDDATMRLLAAILAAAAGVAAIETWDADHAMRILRCTPTIDLVMTDIQMPGSIEGIGLVKAAGLAWPRLRFIIVSSTATLEQPVSEHRALFYRKAYDCRMMIETFRRFGSKRRLWSDYHGPLVPECRP